MDFMLTMLDEVLKPLLASIRDTLNFKGRNTAPLPDEMFQGSKNGNDP
jgi:hypothetical protein